MRWQLSERGRKFAREVGGVVLGVVIALGLGAVAAEIGWQLEVRTARNALQVELGEIIGQADERVNFAPCVERRLDQIAGIVDAAERRGVLPPLGAIAQPPWRSWPTGVWQSTVSAQTAAHFDRDILDNYSSAYDFARVIESYNARELDGWTRLSTIVGPGRPFSTTEAVQLRLAISEARVSHRMIALAGIRLKQIVDAYELGYEADSAREYSERNPREFPICQPISNSPAASYGQAPFDDIIARARRTPITR